MQFLNIFHVLIAIALIAFVLIQIATDMLYRLVDPRVA